jgi:integrase
LLQISTFPATGKAADHYQIYEILGHSDVEVTHNVYDHPETENFREPLAAVADQL